nr:DUF6629 family protein [Micromonospora sp. DSM 115978]
VVAAAVIGAAGIDALRHARSRREVPLASLPLLFAAHTFVEAFVWWGLRGQVGDGVEAVAVAVYLGFALVVLPVYAPTTMLALEQGDGRWLPGRRGVVLAAVMAGVVTAAALAAALIRGPVTVRAEQHHVVYSVELWAGPVVVVLYLFATCGAFLVASRPFLRWFGAVNLVAVGVLAWLATHAVISLWCFWAAVVSIAIALHLRRQRSQGQPRVLSR